MWELSNYLQAYFLDYPSCLFLFIERAKVNPLNPRSASPNTAKATVSALVPASGRLEGVEVGVFVGLGVGLGVADVLTLGVGVGVEVSLGVGLGVGVSVAVGRVVGVADGVDTNAGSSAACTIKFLVRVLNIPLASLQEIVILWGPGESPSGGDHCHSPDEGMVTTCVCGSDSTVIVIAVAEGPSPKNSGSAVVTTSPSSMLSMVTGFPDAEAVLSGVSKPDSNCSCGISSWAWGRPDSILGGRFLKS